MRIIKEKTLLSWLFLMLAIFFEVLSTGILKVGENKPYSYLIMALFISISYYLMALAIRKIQVGIAYAIWEILGSVCIVLMSVFIFDESLNNRQIIGIILAVVGISLINIGELRKP